VKAAQDQLGLLTQLLPTELSGRGTCIARYVRVAARKERTIKSALDERTAVQLSAAVDSADPARLAGIEDDLGEGSHWGMTVGLSQAGVRTQIALQHLGRPAGAVREAAPTVWTAMCRLEQMLQERRGERTASGRRSHAELLGAE